MALPSWTAAASVVRQPIFLDLVAVGLEQHLGAAMIAHLLGAALDHAVALAGLLIKHLSGPGNLEALFGARLGLQLGHLALLLSAGMRPKRPRRQRCSCGAELDKRLALSFFP